MKISFFLLLSFFLFSCKEEIKPPEDNINFSKAIVCRDSKAYDSAFYYYNLAKIDFIEAKDSISSAKSLINMAYIQNGKGDFLGGIESSLEANKFLKREKDNSVRSLLGKNYNSIAISFNYLKDYDSAYSFYNKALKYIENNEDRYVCYNNIGDLLISQGKINKAKKYLEKAVLADSSYNYSRALNNFAKVKYLDDKNYDPLPELYRALEIREKTQDGPGQNSSFETLSTYYLDKNNKLSLEFARKMLQAATNNESPDDQILALQRIINLDPKSYLENFQRFNSINDSLQISRNKDKRQFAIIRFDVDKIKDEKAEKEVELLQRNIGIIALLLAITFIIIWYRKRQKRLKQENELKIKNTQLKLSKKVHDVVANGIYQVMTKIENQEQFDKDKMLDELEFVYEKSRDISYEKTESGNEEKDFSEEISELIGSFNNENVKTYLAGNDKNIWFKVEETTKDEIYQIIRELLVNMKKHSKADRVVFRFERENDVIKIYYTDNGIGISGDVIYKNGLSSTVSRMESMNGEIIFDNKTEKGLKINISFPVS
jgi:tetratricopeptide (TPR) repeat protein